MTVLTTQRLTLRRARAADLNDLHAIFSDPRAMRYWTRPAHDDIAPTKAMLQSLLHPQNADEFVIERAGRVIGKCGGWNLPEIGFILHPDQMRQGLMTEALNSLIPHLFTRHSLPRLTAEADPRNIASLTLLMNLGFIETHRAKNTLKWGDEWCDSVYLALTNPALAEQTNFSQKNCNRPA